MILALIRALVFILALVVIFLRATRIINEDGAILFNTVRWFGISKGAWTKLLWHHFSAPQHLHLSLTHTALPIPHVIWTAFGSSPTGSSYLHGALHSPLPFLHS